MSKKQDEKKSKRPEVSLTPEEVRELDMILDRLSVQDPDGESLQGYLKSLRSALGGQPKLVVGLLDRLSKNPSRVGFAAYQALGDVVEDKVFKRVVKQAGYRFKQRGFDTEEKKGPEGTVVIIPKETRTPVAHILPISGPLYLLSAIIPGEALAPPMAVTAYMDERFEHFHVQVTESSFKLYKEYIRNMLVHLENRKPCEVPLWHVARLLFEMSELYKGKAPVGEFLEAKRLLEPYHDPKRHPYAYELMEQVDSSRERLEELDLEALMAEVDVPWLLFSLEELTPYHLRIQEMEHPVLVVPEEIQHERVRDIVRVAADELCIGERKYFYQRFFEEQALWMKLSGQEGLAASAWAVAQHLAGDAPASENPVITHLLVLSLQTHWPEDFEQTPKGDEAPQVTESGIILPP